MSGSGEMAKMPGMGGMDIKNLLGGEGTSKPQAPPSPMMQSPDNGAAPSLSLTGGNSGLGQIGAGPLQSSFGQRASPSLPQSSSGPGAVFSLPGFTDQQYTPNSSVQAPLQNTATAREDPHSNLLKALMLEMKNKMGSMGGAMQTVNQQVGGGQTGAALGQNSWANQMKNIMTPPKPVHDPNKPTLQGFKVPKTTTGAYNGNSKQYQDYKKALDKYNAEKGSDSGGKT